MNYAHINDGVVDEILPPIMLPLEKFFHPDYVKDCHIIPANQSVGVGWLFKNGVFSQPLPPAMPPKTRLFKSDVWRRATDDEAASLDAALAAAPARLRRLWDDSTILETDSPEWPELAAGVAAVLGPTRAAELLAPTF